MPGVIDTYPLNTDHFPPPMLAELVTRVHKTFAEADPHAARHSTAGGWLAELNQPQPTLHLSVVAQDLERAFPEIHGFAVGRSYPGTPFGRIVHRYLSPGVGRWDRDEATRMLGDMQTDALYARMRGEPVRLQHVFEETRPNEEPLFTGRRINIDYIPAPLGGEVPELGCQLRVATERDALTPEQLRDYLSHYARDLTGEGFDALAGRHPETWGKMGEQLGAIDRRERPILDPAERIKMLAGPQRGR